MDIQQRPQREIFVPLPGPPDVARPSPDVYQQMGADNIYQMLADFYAELSQSTIRHLFAGDLQAAARHSGDYFIGFLGGPPIYTQRRGHPRLRMRHIPFAIDEKARQEWLRCFDKILDCAVERYHFPPQELPVFRNWLHVFSEWMINTK